MTRKKILSFLIVACVLALSFALTLRSADKDDKDDDARPVKLLGSIPIPGNPIASTDIIWVDQATGLVVFADRSNAAVEVIDGKHDLFVGRATMGPGSAHFGGTGLGPNGVVTTRNKKVWAGDGDSTVKVVDLDPSHTATYLQIIATISTAGVGPLSNCTGGFSGTCNRVDEVAYDPEDEVIAVANDRPASGSPPVAIQPYLTFISALPPYKVLGQLNFAAEGATADGGLEQPLWDPKIHRFLQTVPSTNAIQVIKLSFSPSFSAKVDRTIPTGSTCSPTGEALALNGHVLVSCGAFPRVIDVATGNIIGTTITEVGGGDEVNYNPGDNRFVVAANVSGVATNPIVLGVIDPDSGEWLQNAPLPGGLAASGRAGNPAALGSNNHEFVIVKPAKGVSDICGFFTPPPVAPAVVGTPVDFGCVAVFGPAGHRDRDDKDRDHKDRDRGDNDHGDFR